MKKIKDVKKYIDLLFKYRPRTRKEIYLRLKNMGFNEEEIKKEIERLEREGVIDDEKFARLFVIEEINKRPVSKDLLIEKLLKKGVTLETAKKVVEKEYDEDIILETSCKILENFKRKGLTEENIYRYFLRRGFEKSFIEKILFKGFNSL
ncbi:MAG: RecX family transcriptional regulator [Candidatus Hydrothermales bacterium]